MADNWSLLEVEAVVADYFLMLSKELRGEQYNKSTHRVSLSSTLNNRSDGSIERKHQNISAILIEQGYPYISGYKPLANYQKLLAEVVLARLIKDIALESAVSISVNAPVKTPSVEDFLGCMVSPPESDEKVKGVSVRESHSFYKAKNINYLEIETRNSLLGLAGEEFAFNFEKARLIAEDRPDLADRIEYISVSEGDGAGFDIKSYETDGRDRFIEVKTTAYGKQTPIFLSENELKVSQQKKFQYHLYRVYQFRVKPKVFILPGSFDTNLRLEPIQFRGHFM